ncbi:hypothetical protein DC522_05880 [Microvirga sp. KLBC 81]|nr:hypothetical protein DC522_05880 [Microvirga sp. KLBC 81]
MSAEILNLFGSERTEPEGPHLSGQAVCMACKHEWVAGAPVGTVHLECPACKRTWGQFKNPVEPSVAWSCQCGEQLFWITPNGCQCRACGSIQEGMF